MNPFYDTHSHLDYPDFAADLPRIVERAQAAGITKIVTIGTDLASSARAIELARQYPCLSAVVGWHPNDAAQAPEDIRPALRELERNPEVVALGETGLDYYRLPGAEAGGDPAGNAPAIAKQKAIFTQHLEVAAELGLNCVVHQRNALEDTLALFRPYAGRVRAVFHCFVDDAATARRVFELGCLVSFTGILTFKNGRNVRDTLVQVPLGKFLLETDSPFLAPVPYRGQRCEPAYVREIAHTVAEVKRCSLEELSIATCQAADGFFVRRG